MIIVVNIFIIFHFIGVRQAAKGLHLDKPWVVDKNFPEAIRDQLFNQRRDLIALNLNRGRDHGLDSYANYRRAYGLSVPNSWNDLHRTHPRDVVRQLQSVYSDVGDVELYIGGKLLVLFKFKLCETQAFL